MALVEASGGAAADFFFFLLLLPPLAAADSFAAEASVKVGSGAVSGTGRAPADARGRSELEVVVDVSRDSVFPDPFAHFPINFSLTIEVFWLCEIIRSKDLMVFGGLTHSPLPLYHCNQRS